MLKTTQRNKMKKKAGAGILTSLSWTNITVLFKKLDDFKYFCSYFNVHC